MATLMRWDPLNDLMSLQHNVDRLFSDMGMMRTPTLPTGRGRTETMIPSMDVYTDGNDLKLYTELPGVSADDVDISVTDGVLTLTAERHEHHSVDEKDYIVRETSWGTVQRSVRLPEHAEIDKIHADFADGILEITVPNAAPQESRTHKIAVEAHTDTKKLTSHH